MEKPTLFHRLCRMLGWNVCALSALVGILVACLWWRSATGFDRITIAGESTPWSPSPGDKLERASTLQIIAGAGKLHLAWHEDAASGVLPRFEWHAARQEFADAWAYPQVRPEPRSTLGMVWAHGQYYPLWPEDPTPPAIAALPSFPCTILVVPYWALLAGTAILPMVALTRWILLRRRRGLRDKGRCAHCGYDLRASPVRCPECGNPVDSAPRRSRMSALRHSAFYLWPTALCLGVCAATLILVFRHFCVTETGPFTDAQIVAAYKMGARVGVCRIDSRRIAAGAWGDHTNYGGIAEQDFSNNRLFGQVYGTEMDVQPGRFLFLPLGKRYLMITNALPTPFKIHVEADPSDERIQHVKELMEKAK